MRAQTLIVSHYRVHYCEPRTMLISPGVGWNKWYILIRGEDAADAPGCRCSWPGGHVCVAPRGVRFLLLDRGENVFSDLSATFGFCSDSRYGVSEFDYLCWQKGILNYFVAGLFSSSGCTDFYVPYETNYGSVHLKFDKAIASSFFKKITMMKAYHGYRNRLGSQRSFLNIRHWTTI